MDITYSIYDFVFFKGRNMILAFFLKGKISFSFLNFHKNYFSFLNFAKHSTFHHSIYIR